MNSSLNNIIRTESTDSDDMRKRNEEELSEIERLDKHRILRNNVLV